MKMKQMGKLLLMMSLLLLPVWVSAKENILPLGMAFSSFGDSVGLFGLYGMELFVSIHMTVFVIIPLSGIFGKDKKGLAAITMFCARAVFLIIATPIYPEIALVDFFAVFVGAFAVVPICCLLFRKNLFEAGFGSIKTIPSALTDNANMTVPEGNIDAVWNATTMKEAVVDPKYLKSDEGFLLDIINEELKKQNVNFHMRTPYINQRKQMICIIFAVINFIALSFFFFHIPSYIPIILEVLTILILLIVGSRFNLKKNLIKEITSRPDEKIDYIISNTVNNAVSSNAITNVLILLISFILPLGIYKDPHILYEYNKEEEGYYVRFYTVGLEKAETVTIPETYKGKPVVGIRGNVFANMKDLKIVTLPDTIKTIRGKAFLNDSSLIEVNLPEQLTYLGGSSFKNCISLKSIIIPYGLREIQGATFMNCESLVEVSIPNSVYEIHGEAFSGCSSLPEITLPGEITEIHGNTFEYCTSLRRIEIPEGVIRIGGHAFYGCTSLSEVILPSTLKEIGSSAFRQCSSLYEISVPAETIINERAFKESPTTVHHGDGEYHSYY